MVEQLIAFVTNKIVISTVIALLIAQILKFIIHYIMKKEVDISVLLFQYGGMPSSHSSFVMALTTGIFMTEGITTTFIVCLGLSLIVIRDAIGVRKQIEQQAKTLNKIIKAIKYKEFKGKYLKELVGHTPLQVLMGSLLGILTTIIVFLN
ncbi:divergent PAP2 family protein [Nanoarchaeota archaeon]